ncbi:MAG: enoyl-CoA hydratase/isomerase family protein [Acidobacteriota bacterium]
MIERREHGDVTVLELRHGKANALDVELLDDVRAHLEQLGRDGRAVVLTGHDGFFCAGVDLRRVVDSDRTYTVDLIAALDRCLGEMVRFPRPLVAAINGHAIAGGLVLACACDYRLVGSDEARLGLTELAVGVPFPPRAFEVVRLAVGAVTAKRLVLGADLIESRQAVDLGIVDEVVASEDLESRAVEVATSWARLPEKTFALTKSQLNSELELRLGDQPADLAAAVRECWISEPTRAAIKRFVAAKLSGGRV